MRRLWRHWAARLQADDQGNALVEFAVTLPMLLALFALFVEGGRILWAHQQLVVATRDATRYVSRVADPANCNGSVAGVNATAVNLVRNSQLAGGSNNLPVDVTVTSINIACAANNAFRAPFQAEIVLTANATIQLPFAGLFQLVGGANAGTLNYTISDRARVYGE